jgi:sugar phosphate isomerase/epimerase
MSKMDYDILIEKLTHSLKILCEKGQQTGTYIALELQPGAIIQGVAHFLQMLAILKENPYLTYNFDTGHAHATKDVVELIPVRLGSRITGTHLCDNNGNENLSLTPTEGNINWERVISALKKNHYSGSYDLEIMCQKDKVKLKYEKGLTYIKKLLSD